MLGLFEFDRSVDFATYVVISVLTRWAGAPWCVFKQTQVYECIREARIKEKKEDMKIQSKKESKKHGLEPIER